MVPVVRQTDPAFLNKVVNHEDVRPWLGGDLAQPIDLTPNIADPRNYAFAGEHGGILFQHITPGVYEAHTQVLPDGRGAWTMEMVLSCLHEMFCGSDAIEIVTRVPEGNIAARALVKRLGQIIPVDEIMERTVWVENDQRRLCAFFSMTIQSWMKCAPELPDFGSELLAQLREDDMTEDRERDRYLGVAWEMMRRGLPMKAALFYNRWATLAYHFPMRIESISPLVIEIGGKRVGLMSDGGAPVVLH